MIKVSIYEQDLFGTVHWRVMRDDGRLIFDRFQTDFPSREEAVSACQGEFRRNHLVGTARIVSTQRQGWGVERFTETIPLPLPE